MSKKIHKKTGLVCMVCDNVHGIHPPEGTGSGYIIFHKTRRQTHSLCITCCIEYLRPIVKMACNNLRKNITNGVGVFRCPGSYHSEHRNQCKTLLSLKNLNNDAIGKSDISLDIFRINYIISNNLTSAGSCILCLNQDCGQIIILDPDYVTNSIVCYSCKQNWCRECLVSPYHEGMSCIELEVNNSNSEIGKFIAEMNALGKLKFCPQCRVPCIKYNGCNKMTCSMCCVKWCWLCMCFNIDYDHYNTENVGTCVGMLWKGVDPDPEPVDELIIYDADEEIVV